MSEPIILMQSLGKILLPFLFLQGLGTVRHSTFEQPFDRIDHISSIFVDVATDVEGVDVSEHVGIKDVEAEFVPELTVLPDGKIGKVARTFERDRQGAFRHDREGHGLSKATPVTDNVQQVGWTFARVAKGESVSRETGVENSGGDLQWRQVGSGLGLPAQSRLRVNSPSLDESGNYSDECRHTEEDGCSVHDSAIPVENADTVV